MIGREAQAAALQDETVEHGAKILPAECGANRDAAAGIEDDRRGTLVRDPEDLAGADLTQGSLRELECETSDLRAVELGLTRVGRADREGVLENVRDRARLVDNAGSHR